MNYDFQILGINPNSSKDQVIQAYRKLTLLYHPDKNKNISSDIFIQIKNSYENIMKNFNNDDDEIKNLIDTLSIKYNLSDYEKKQILLLLDFKNYSSDYLYQIIIKILINRITNYLI